MSKELTISIVIPVYNEQSHIGVCLKAIGQQTIKPLEVIVVDNNSTDKTVEFARAYPFVTMLSETKQGIVFARNKGFDAAKGNIIARIDADTLLPPDWLEKVTVFYQNPSNQEMALTGGGYFYNVRARRFFAWLQSQLAYRLNRLIVSHYILWGSNMAMPQHLWRAVKSDVCQRTDLHEDMDLAIHVHRAGYKIHYEAKTLQVGVYLKRVFSNRSELHTHMRRWPDTLRLHGYSLWWLGVVGNLYLWYIVQPTIFVLEGISRLLGRPKLN